jgi:hypothetical protein
VLTKRLRTVRVVNRRSSPRGMAALAPNVGSLLELGRYLLTPNGGSLFELDHPLPPRPRWRLPHPQEYWSTSCSARWYGRCRRSGWTKVLLHLLVPL